jgi:hypothetical protein
VTRAAVLVLALGCGTGAVPAAARPATGRGVAAPAGKTAVSPLSYLTDEFERVFPERVRLARYGAVRLAAGDGEPAAGSKGDGEAIELGQSPALVVVDSAGDRLRIVVEEGEYRLLLWIEASDLNWVIAETADLAFEPGERAAAPPSPGVRVRPGLPVVRGDQRGQLVFVSHDDQCITVAGWVPVGLLARTYTPVDQPEIERDLSAGAGTALLERPNGRELARFTSECHVAYGGREESGQKLVVYEGNGFEVRGWISGSSSGGGTSSLFGYGRAFGGFGGGERILVPAGSCLYAARGGAVVGVTTDDAEETGVQAGEGGWHSVSVETGWGDLSVWIREEGKQPAEETEEDGLLGVKKVRQLRLTKCR